MGIIVQKYGGTSVATENARLSLLRHVKKAKEEGYDVVVVVSAMGRKGEPYATDTILGLLESIDPCIDPCKKDLIISCGEIISCSLIAHYLEINSIESVALTGFQAGILTNEDFSDSDIITIDTTNILKYLNLGKVPVIAGFQGITWDGRISTLGRGGSDTSAVELGGYLKADVVDIFTDVQGVAIIDPRVIPSTSFLSGISYSDMYKLAINGAKVIHPRAVKSAEKFGIPVRVRSTFTDGEGTLISGLTVEEDRKIIGITLDKEYTHIQMEKKDKAAMEFNSVGPIMYTEKDNTVSGYIKNENLKKIQLKVSHQCIANVSIISVFYNSRYKNIVREEIGNIIENSGIETLDVLYFEDHITILIDENAAVPYMKEIYSLV